MKITTRLTTWGIELKNDSVTDDISEQNQIELKETMLNFLEATRDISFILDYPNFKDEISEGITSLIQRLEDI